MFETEITKHTQAANATYAATTHPAAMAHTGPAPTSHYAIVTCMDARLLPSVPTALGIAPGSAHIIRNGGGSARDALRSLLGSQHMLGTTEILLIKHTDCGFQHFDSNDIPRGKIAELGPEATTIADGIDFEPIGQELEGKTKSDVEFLRGCEALKHRDKISGWIWETDSGKLKRVC